MCNGSWVEKQIFMLPRILWTAESLPGCSSTLWYLLYLMIHILGCVKSSPACGYKQIKREFPWTSTFPFYLWKALWAYRPRRTTTRSFSGNMLYVSLKFMAYFWHHILMHKIVYRLAFYFFFLEQESIYCCWTLKNIQYIQIYKALLMYSC